MSANGDVGQVVVLSLVANDVNATPLIELVVIEIDGVNGPGCDGVSFDTATGVVAVTVIVPAVCRYQYGIETPAGSSAAANVIIFIGVNI